MRLTRGLPNGLFDNARSPLISRGCSTSRAAPTISASSGDKLFIVAADLDSGSAAPFGAPGFDDVPISEAVKASSALPGLYPPARIGDATMSTAP